MCFSLHNTSKDALFIPSKKAKDLGQIIRYLVILLCFITVSGFIGGHFVVAIFSVGTILTMWHSIHDNDQYNIESTQRIVFFAGYLCIFSTIACIQSISKSNANNMSLTWIQLFGGLIFYALAAYIGNKLYNELRLNCHKISQ
eukprot:383400_1